MTAAMPTPKNTVLGAVLEACGAWCGCEGACGRTHKGGVCAYGKGRLSALHAAPYPPRVTDVENAAASAAELRPWCSACWSRAHRLECERAAEARRIALAGAQLALFDPAG
ncbi:hypothetical protein [Streptomyces sp. NPDC012508]|uniref:hypothetical protein n=1 Tax=Streptomyces sp. NPDC012508 TaxID=3364837 RepID=UPI0036C7979B